MNDKPSRYNLEKNDVDHENVEKSYITLDGILQYAIGAKDKNVWHILYFARRVLWGQFQDDGFVIE